MLLRFRAASLSARTDITVAELHRQFMGIKTSSRRLRSRIRVRLGEAASHIGDRPLRKLRAIDLDRAYVAIGQSVARTPPSSATSTPLLWLQQAMKWELVSRTLLSPRRRRSRPVNVPPPTGDELVKLVGQRRSPTGSSARSCTSRDDRRAARGARWLALVRCRPRQREHPTPTTNPTSGRPGPLKNKLARTVLLDDDTLTMLRSHGERWRQVAKDCAVATQNCFVFSPTPGNTESFRPTG